VVFNNLPDGVELADPSGTDSQGNPYVNLRRAIASGGLDIGGVSETVEVTFHNPNLLRFGLDTSVFVGRPNSAPVFKPIDHLTVVPGAKLALPLTATDRDGDPVTYQLQSDNPLPTGKLEGDGTLRFNPKPDEIGSYEFTLIATDGAESVSQTVTIDVVADPITTTRISGVILNVEQQPLEGVVIELGELEAVTAEDGSFTIETDQPLTADTLKVKGKGLAGDQVYPSIAEKLPLLLGQEVYAGFNNVIDRPIYLPALDVASGQVIDPNKDITVTSENIPEASVFVEAGSLITQSGDAFTGTLSITEVPTELTPAALPENLSPDLVVTIQPGEMVFLNPAPLSLPNRAGYAPGTKMDLWSINPETGDFDKVGKSQVSADGKVIETIEGGIRNSSWHFVAPPPPPEPKDPEKEKRNEEDECGRCQDKKSINSYVESHSGALIENHELVTYQSNGKEQGIDLTYDSSRADPRPIVHFSYGNVRPDPQVKLVANLTFGGNNFPYQVPGVTGNSSDLIRLGLRGGDHLWSIPEGIVDEVGLATVLSYNEAGLVSKISDPANRETLLNYDTAGNLISITDPDDSTRTWKYDGKHHMVGEIDPLGNSEQTFYDFAGRVSQGVRKDGSVNKINPVQVEGLYRPEATTNITSPPSAHRLSEEIFSSFADGNGNVEVSQLDQAGQVIQSLDEVGSSVSSIERNADNLITSTVDGKGVKTEYTYDEQGNVLTIKDSLTLANNAGGNALIINGAATSSEPPLAQAATDTVESLLEDSGYETTISEGIPQDILEYEQIWDLRVDNNTALSNTQSNMISRGIWSKLLTPWGIVVSKNMTS